MRSRTALLGFILLTGCSSGSVANQPTPSALVSGSPSAAPNGGPLVPSTVPWPAYVPTTGPCAPALPSGAGPFMVVYEPNADVQGAQLGQYARVVIADSQAFGRARGAFATSIAYRSVYPVMGSVYVLDGLGTVFRMGLDSVQTVVARFPNATSFSVSADGCQLAAVALHFDQATLTYTLSTEMAIAGGLTKVLHSWTTTNTGPIGDADSFVSPALIGWDSAGPIVAEGWQQVTALPDVLSHVNNPDLLGARIAHLAGDGRIGSSAAPQSCRPAQLSFGGLFTCYLADSGGTGLEIVRSADGSILSNLGLPNGVQRSCEFPANVGFPCTGADVAVAADGSLAATWATSNTPTTDGFWRRTDGTNGALPPFFYVEGWVDSQTLFGRLTGAVDQAALAHVGAAQPTLEDLHFTGRFVGMLG